MQLLALLLLRIDKIAGADKDIFPLCQDAVSEVGKPGYPGGLITRRAVSTCKIAGGRKFKSTPRYCLFFQQEFCLFQCRTFVAALSNACVLSVLECIIQF